MRIKNVKSHVLKSVPSSALQEFRNGGPYKFLRTDPVVRDNWISFTALDWNAVENCLDIGLTAFDTDILWRFHPSSSKFESLGFAEVANDPQRIKIHRGLTPDGDGGCYFGTAGLPDLDERNETIGGGVYHYKGGRYEFLGVPMPCDYIQNIEVDEKRHRVYGITYPGMYFFEYDYINRKTIFSLFTRSHFHESGLDDDGFFWGTWSARRGHCLFRYHPEVGRPEFFHQPIPNLGPDHPFQFTMNGPIDSFLNGNDGFLYFGTTSGELYQLDPQSGKHALLGRPSPGLRLSGLVLGPEGNLLGSYGAYSQTGLFMYDRASCKFADLGPLRDETDACFMVHDIAWDGGVRVFAAETDNLERSGYLWEATLG